MLLALQSLSHGDHGDHHHHHHHHEHLRFLEEDGGNATTVDRHCGSPENTHKPPSARRLPRNVNTPSVADCSNQKTTLRDAYLPSRGTHKIKTVVWNLHDGTNGMISAECAQAGIELLNQDFRKYGQGLQGYDTGIEFELVHFGQHDNACWAHDHHPDGYPGWDAADAGVSGCGSVGDYYSTNSWDVNKYMNIYLPYKVRNDALGYVAGFPQDNCDDEDAGGDDGCKGYDRVVIGARQYGPEAGTACPMTSTTFGMGRTMTHEVGHYLGLFHTHSHVPFPYCPSNLEPPNCYEDSDSWGEGDLICDTNHQDSATYGCENGKDSCNGAGQHEPVDNFMSYSDDSCMTHFTAEQTQRMRCTLMNYRNELADSGPPGPDAPPLPAPAPSPAPPSPPPPPPPSPPPPGPQPPPAPQSPPPPPPPSPPPPSPSPPAPHPPPHPPGMAPEPSPGPPPSPGPAAPPESPPREEGGGGGGGGGNSNVDVLMERDMKNAVVAIGILGGLAALLTAAWKVGAYDKCANMLSGAPAGKNIRNSTRIKPSNLGGGAMGGKMGGGAVTMKDVEIARPPLVPQLSKVGSNGRMRCPSASGAWERHVAGEEGVGLTSPYAQDMSAPSPLAPAAVQWEAGAHAALPVAGMATSTYGANLVNTYHGGNFAPPTYGVPGGPPPLPTSVARPPPLPSSPVRARVQGGDGGATQGQLYTSHL